MRYRRLLIAMGRELEVRVGMDEGEKQRVMYMREDLMHNLLSDLKVELKRRKFDFSGCNWDEVWEELEVIENDEAFLEGRAVRKYLRRREEGNGEENRTPNRQEEEGGGGGRKWC